MWIHASGVLDFLLDCTALWVGGLRKVGIDLQRRNIGLHRVAWLRRPFTQRSPPFEPIEFIHVQEYRKYSSAETSGHQILVSSPSLMYLIYPLHSQSNSRRQYRNSSDKVQRGKESDFCSVLFLSPN